MFSNETINALIDLANECKNVRRYVLTNAIFAMLFDMAINEGLPLELEWESEDEERPGEIHRDLAVLILEGKSLCIPAPILSEEARYAALKRSTIVERREHTRQYQAQEDESFGAETFAEILKDEGLHPIGVAVHLRRAAWVLNEKNVAANEALGFIEEIVRAAVVAA